MNSTEYNLAGVADSLRRDAGLLRVRVFRMRYETALSEDGKETSQLVRDDIGMGDTAVATVEAADGPPGVSVVVPFALELLKDMSPRAVANLLAPRLKESLNQLVT